MAFLTDDDYSLLVAPEDLDVVTQSTEANRDLAETMAMEQMKGYLSQRYDTEAIFAAEDDERNPLIVMYMMDITLFHLHGHLPDRMGLEQRRIRYEDALKWLKDVCYYKTINPDLPVPEDDDLSPLPISWGSETRKNYKY